MQLSATIVTLNEERNLARAIETLAFCDEVLVIDSGSTDATVEVAERAGARVISRAWAGYCDQKNFAAGEARNDWILSLDADEALSPELAGAIRRLTAGEPSEAGFRFPRRARYLGEWIRHSGWYPDAKVRLYDRRRARWEGAYVHESVVVEGPVGELEGDLLHYTCDDLSAHIQTVDRYTTLAAQEWIDRRRRAPLWRLAVGPPWAFVRSFVLKLGFLDGARGFLIAVMAAFYVFAKYAKTRFASDAA